MLGQTAVNADTVLMQQLLAIKTHETRVQNLVYRLRTGQMSDAKLVGAELDHLLGQVESLESILEGRQAV